ncbi:hypothetical protein [Saccharothrix stipae]
MSQPEQPDSEASTPPSASAGGKRAEFARRLAARQSHSRQVARLAMLEEHLGGPPRPEVVEPVRRLLYGDAPAPRAAG